MRGGLVSRSEVRMHKEQARFWSVFWIETRASRASKDSRGRRCPTVVESPWPAVASGQPLAPTAHRSGPRRGEASPGTKSWRRNPETRRRGRVSRQKSDIFPRKTATATRRRPLATLYHNSLAPDAAEPAGVTAQHGGASVSAPAWLCALECGARSYVSPYGALEAHVCVLGVRVGVAGL